MNSVILLLVGGVYAMVFLIVAASRPKIALLMIAASAPFQNDISGGGPVKFSLAEIHLVLTLPVLLLRSRHLKLGATFLPAALYITLGLAFTIPQWRASSLTSLVQIGIYFIIVVVVFASLARSEYDYKLALHGFIGVCAMLALLVCVKQDAYVLGLHKNGVGSSIAVALVTTFALWSGKCPKKMRWRYGLAMLLLAAGCVTTLSRGAWLTAMVGIFVVLSMRRQFALMLKSALALAPLIAVCWWSLPQESREYATGFGKERFNIKLRYQSIDFALELYESAPWSGVGVGLRKEYDATNVALLTLAETGIPGLTAFFLVHIAALGSVWRAHLRVGRDTLGFTLLALAAALVSGKLAHGMVDHYWGRGTLTVVWASMGMATFVIATQKRKLRTFLQGPGLPETCVTHRASESLAHPA